MFCERCFLAILRYVAFQACAGGAASALLTASGQACGQVGGQAPLWVTGWWAGRRAPGGAVARAGSRHMGNSGAVATAFMKSPISPWQTLAFQNMQPTLSACLSFKAMAITWLSMHASKNG